MKNNIENKIKACADDVVIKTKYDDVLRKVEKVEIPSKKNKGIKYTKNYNTFGVLALSGALAAAAITGVIVGINNNLPNNYIPEHEFVMAKKDVTMTSTVMSIKMMEQFYETTVSALKMKNNSDTSENTSSQESPHDGEHGEHPGGEHEEKDFSQDYNEVIFSYVDIVDGVLSYDSVSIVEEESDREEYQVKSTFSLSCLDDYKETYTMYYNLELERENHEEKFYSIEGIALNASEEEFVIEGKYSEEVEYDETETELELFLRLDQTNFVKITQEIEEENGETETEYKFEVVQDGRCVNVSEFEIELENNKTKVTLKQNGVRIEFIKSVKDDKTLIKIEIHNDPNVPHIEAYIEISVDEEGNEVYSLVYPEHGHRNGHHDKPERDDHHHRD